jgi:hypothetical protein
MPPAEIEPAIPASERPQTQPLDRAATGIGLFSLSATYEQYLESDKDKITLDRIVL